MAYTAIHAQRKLLDQLMGEDRNLTEEEKARGKSNKIHWSDPKVCKHFLCGFCPAEMFTNTKSDLGACDLLHEVSFRKEFELEPSEKKYEYKVEFLRYIESLIAQLTRKIEHQQGRLDKTLDPESQTADAVEKNRRIDDLNARIGPLMTRIEKGEKLGNYAEVEMLKRILDKYNKEKELLEGEEEVPSIGLLLGPAQDKQMFICDVCGAMLVEKDAEQRVLSHLSGKQHTGYKKIRETIVELSEELEKQRNAPRSISRRPGGFPEPTGYDGRGGFRESHRDAPRDAPRDSYREIRRERTSHRRPDMRRDPGRDYHRERGRDDRDRSRYGMPRRDDRDRGHDDRYRDHLHVKREAPDDRNGGRISVKREVRDDRDRGYTSVKRESRDDRDRGRISVKRESRDDEYRHRGGRDESDRRGYRREPRYRRGY